MKRSTKLLVFVPIVLSLASVACLVSVTVPQATITPQPTETTIPTVIPTAIELTPVEPEVIIVSQEDLLTEMYQKTNPGVVAIRTYSEEEASGGSLGSGFVLDSEGHIVTNFHVVHSATDLEVNFPTGHKTHASIVGMDSDSDIAVLKVDAPSNELFPLILGDSNLLQVGQTVFAIGNPHGLYGTMTTGIISSLGRTMQSLREAPSGSYFTAGGIIQTDAAINPGNSGGPLLNLDGEVVGVNVAISSSTLDINGQPVNSGIGFTIPINIVKRVVPDLISQGYYDYPYIGIGSPPGGELSLFEQEALNLTGKPGVYVIDVAPGSPAEKAGLIGGSVESSIPFIPAGGDLIIAIDDIEVLNFNDLISYLILNKSPGDTLILTVLRGDEQFELELILEKRP